MTFNMNDMKKISLVCAIKNREADLQRGLKDLMGFTQKLPLQWQLIFVIDPSQDDTLKNAQAFAAKGFEVIVISPPRRLGRSRSMLEGLRTATGDYIVTFPIDFTVPLAEMFNFLQELVTKPAVDLVLGNRMTSKKKWQSLKTSWHWTLERIILEKNSHLAVQDPLCAYWAIQKIALQRLLPDLRFRSWYFTLDLLRCARRYNLNILEIPILSNDKRPSAIPLFKEYFRNFF